jgi:hypothetical protein
MQNDYDDWVRRRRCELSHPLFKNDERRDETQMTEHMHVHGYTALQPPLFG